MRIIFAGSIGRFPVGGHAWVDMQYLLGLRALGHEVVYLEECGQESWVYNWRTQEMTDDLDYPTEYLHKCLHSIGFGEQWIYRAGPFARGMPVEAFHDACAGADLLLIRAVGLPLWRSEYDSPRRRAFIDMDPAFTQIHLANGKKDLAQVLERCESVFTIGQRIGARDCPVPLVGREWIRTVPPVYLPAWPASDSAGRHFTSVMQWKSYREVEYAGIRYGNKDREFPKFVDLPQRTRATFELALTGAAPDTFTSRGWEVTEGWKASETPEGYRRYIQGSLAEFGVAKHGYVASRCGWFSDRSVCYLASGRPVLLQDTGLSDWLPLGEGILTFRDIDEAARRADAILGHYDRHRRAARRLAEEFFDASHVLPALLNRALG